MSETQNISMSEAVEVIAKALLPTGVSQECAYSVAEALVAAEAEGQVGHGFSRLADYVAQATSGKVNVSAQPRCNETGATALIVDAENGFAFPALDLAVERCVAAASEYGCAWVGVTRSHHCGALSVQVEKIAKAGLIGMMVANSPPAIAPWGASEPVFGTNPIAFAAPRSGKGPLVIDLSMSRVARGKVMHAKKTGQPIPLGWALDKDGEPTSDPQAALEGSMVPIGEAKGTALALIVEILAATLTGANPSSEVSSFFTADGPPPGSGQFLLAIRPGDATGLAERLEPLLTMIAGMDGARLPGARRANAIKNAQKNGLDVPQHYLELARKLGA